MPSTRTRDARVLDVETHPFSDVDAATAALSAGTSFVAACQNGTLPNVCYIDPAFDNEGTGTSGDDHPQGDIRLGERFIADAYHALADNGYLDNTVFIVTFDEWGGFYDHVPPPVVRAAPTTAARPLRWHRPGDRARPGEGPPLRDSAGISPDFAGCALPRPRPAHGKL